MFGGIKMYHSTNLLCLKPKLTITCLYPACLSCELEFPVPKVVLGTYRVLVKQSFPIVNRNGKFTQLDHIFNIYLGQRLPIEEAKRCFSSSYYDALISSGIKEVAVISVSDSKESGHMEIYPLGMEDIVVSSHEELEEMINKISLGYNSLDINITNSQMSIDHEMRLSLEKNSK